VIKIKPIKNYILVVDGHRRPSRCRNTRGRYRVGAKEPEEAVKLLREKIGFGSIQVLYECRSDDKYNVKYKEVIVDGLEREQPHHANEPRSNYLADDTEKE
jgi:hypothetical protein